MVAYRAPFVPTPLTILHAALRAAWVTPCDTVYDLGAGDGRVVVVAARDYCVSRAVGVEIDPLLAEVARAYARMYGVSDRVVIVEEDFMKTSISDATLVYIYLYKSINEALRPKLEAELSPGTRVVTIDFPVPGWVPVYVKRLRDESDILRTIHVYVIGLSDSYWSSRRKRIESTATLEAWLACPKNCRGPQQEPGTGTV